MFRQCTNQVNAMALVLIMLVLSVQSEVLADAVQEFNGPYRTWLNVQDFGAKGDGQTDDTIAFKKALASLCEQADRGVLYVPAGTYRITDTLTFASLEEEYNPKRKAAIGKSIMGHHPDDTTLLWDGKADGTMLYLTGQKHCTYGRMTFDGNHKASIAVRVERHHWLKTYSTYGRFVDCVFRNSEYGIYNTDENNKHEMDSEYQFLRCQFIGMTKAGIRIDAGNTYDWWVRHCRFEDCDRGIWNTYGDFYAMQNTFLRSKTADMDIRGHRAGGMRDNYSFGSNRFAIVYQSTVLLDRNMIVSPKQSPVIQFDGGQHSDTASLLLLDNTVVWPDAPNDAALVSLEQQKSRPFIVIGNRSVGFEPRLIGDFEGIVHDNKMIDASSVDASEPKLPTTPPNVQRQVFYAENCNDWQSAVDQAVAYCKDHPDARPVVHLAPKPGMLKETVEVPANLPIKLTGDGEATTITWYGPHSPTKSALLLRGPSRATVMNMQFRHGREYRGDPKITDTQGQPLRHSPIADILIDNADQPGARVLSNYAWLSGVFADRLEHTQIDLLDHYAASYGPWVYATLKSLGPPSGKGDSRIAMFGGVVIGDNIFAHVVDGGRILMRDFWHENNKPMIHPWALMEGQGARQGAFNLETAYLYKHPSGPMFEIRDYDGDMLSIASLMSRKTNRIDAHKPLEKTNLLSLVGRVEYDRYSAMANRSVLVNDCGDQLDDDQLPWVLSQLHGLRSAMPKRIDEPRPDGVTDVLIEKVTGTYQNGWGLWVKPDRHEYQDVGVSVHSDIFEASEENEKPGQFVLLRDDWTEPLTVKYRLVGTATQADYKQTAEGQITFESGQRRVDWPLTPVDDTETESPEYVKMQLLPGDGYVVGVPRQSERDRLYIQCNDHQQSVTIKQFDDSIREDKRPGLTDDGSVTIERNKSQGDLTVNLQWSGDASTDDFEPPLPKHVMIPDGQHAVKIKLIAKDDAVYESVETLKLNLASSDQYDCDPSQTTSFTISDNDRIQITVTAKPVDGIAHSMTFARNGTAGDLPLTYHITPENPEENQNITGNVTILNGQTSITLPVPEQVRSSPKSKWTVAVDTFAHASHAVLSIPEKASRYWWLVSDNQLASIDLHASQWRDKANQPGKAVIAHTVTVPEKVLADPHWKMPENISAGVRVAYDPIDDALWLQIGYNTRRNKEAPGQSLWRIEGINGPNPSFRKWAYRQQPDFRNSEISLLANRDLLLSFGGYPNHTSIQSRLAPSGELTSKIHMPFSDMVALADGGISVRHDKRIYVWPGEQSALSLDNAKVFEDGQNQGALIALPVSSRTQLGNDPILIATQQYATGQLICPTQSTDLFGEIYKAYDGRTQMGQWDPTGRLWLIPTENHSNGVILDPEANFKQVQVRDDIQYDTRISFDQEYVYGVRIGHKSNLMSRRLHDGGKVSYIKIPADRDNSLSPVQGDPTGYQWYRLTQQPQIPHVQLTGHESK